MIILIVENSKVARSLIKSEFEGAGYILREAVTGSTIGSAGEKGKGLAMGIVRDLVEAHKGKINIESQVGVGTKIRVVFPGVTK